MERLIPDGEKTIELNLQVNGDFTKEEQQTIVQFVSEELMCSKTHYALLLDDFCYRNNFNFSINHHTVTIYK